jgi:dTDP-4-amino-4,6-dideoxygalactose transaminase
LCKRLAKTSFEALATSPLLFNLGVYPALRFAPRQPGAEDRFASGYDGDEISMRGKTGLYTNYQAHLGRRQLQRAAAQADRRRHNAERLISQLRDVVRLQEPVGRGVKANYMLVTALFSDMPNVCDRLLKLGIDSKHHYMRDCSGLLDDRGHFPNAAQAEREVLHLPAYPELSDRQIDQVAARVRQVVAPAEASRRLQVG